MRGRLVLSLVLATGAVFFAAGGETAPMVLPLPPDATGLALAWTPRGEALAVVYLGDDLSLWLRVMEVPEGDVRWEKRIGEIPRGDPRPPVITARVSAERGWIAVGSPWQISVFSSTGELILAYPVGLGELPFLLRFLHADDRSPQDYLALVVARAERWGPPMLASPFAEITLEIRTTDADWELNDDAPLGAWPLPIFAPIAGYSRDGKLFAAAAMNPQTGEWLLGFLGGEAEEGVYYLTGLLGDAAEPTALAVSPDGGEVALGLGTHRPGEVSLIRRLDPVSGEERGAYFPCGEYQCFIANLDWSPDGRYLAYSARAEGFFRLGIVDFEIGEETVLCEGRGNEVCPASPAFSSTGDYLATLGEREVVLWRIPEG